MPYGTVREAVSRIEPVKKLPAVGAVAAGSAHPTPALRTRSLFASIHPVSERREEFRFRAPQQGLLSLDLFEHTPPASGQSAVLDVRPPEEIFGHTPLLSHQLILPTAGSLTSTTDGELAERKQGFYDDMSLPDEGPDQFAQEGATPSQRDMPFPNLFPEIRQRVWNDHVNFYSKDSLIRLGLGLAVAGAVANTGVDAELTKDVRSSFRAGETDQFSALSKQFGNGYYTVPVFAAAALLGQFSDRWPAAGLAGDWGGRCMRTFGVGAPPLLIVQRVTGGSRPGQNEDGSQWIPFQAEHGASGHTFMGAIPFITAAKMTDDPWLKAGFYVCSTFTGWSRLYDNDHYFSQVVLGWWIAYLAASAVDDTEFSSRRFRIVPLTLGDGTGLGIEFRR